MVLRLPTVFCTNTSKQLHADTLHSHNAAIRNIFLRTFNYSVVLSNINNNIAMSQKLYIEILSLLLFPRVAGYLWSCDAHITFL